MISHIRRHIDVGAHHCVGICLGNDAKKFAI